MRSTAMIAVVLFSIAPLVYGDENAADPGAGQKVYGQTCIACHGANGKGAIPGVRDLTAADGPLAKSDAELLASITDGFQSPGSPLAMPPKGGNPSLTQDDIKAVISYLRAEFSE